MSLSVTLFGILLEYVVQVHLFTGYHDHSKGHHLWHQLAIHGNMVLLMMGYYALIHVATLTLFRMTMDSACIISRWKMDNRKLSVKHKHTRPMYLFNFIEATVRNTHLMSELNVYFSQIAVINILMDVPICGAVLVQLAMGRINEEYVWCAMQIFSYMALAILLMHLLFAQFPLLLHAKLKVFIHFNCLFSRTHPPPPLTKHGRLSFRNRLRLCHFIEHHHTNHEVGVHYGPLGVVSVSSCVRVSVF